MTVENATIVYNQREILLPKCYITTKVSSNRVNNLTTIELNKDLNRDDELIHDIYQTLVYEELFGKVLLYFYHDGYEFRQSFDTITLSYNTAVIVLENNPQ